ncbi:MAG: monovalent cation/H+ antiporter subunit D family protein [Anaerosomatales bacterium]|nr:monovalent cation/H+ antiporter subunit D family protein [Anaerosomatales bacterium]
MAYWPHWLVVVVVAPLVGAVLAPVVGRGRPKVVALWALAAMGVTSLAALNLIVRVAEDGPFSYDMGGWEPPVGIELRFDEFGASVGIICLLGMLALLFSYRYAEHTLPTERVPYYYSLMLLNLTGLIGFVVTGDLFNLFVFMEILSLSGYALVAVSGERIAEMAAFKYLVMGAVSSLLVLFSIGVLYSVTGSLNMADVAARLGDWGARSPAMLALAGLSLGFMVKAAIFPVHIWLPDAHAIAPSPVSAILSGLVVKVGVLGMLRVYQIFYAAETLDLTGLNTLLVWLGAISIVMGAFFAIFQEDVKMMLAYSTISNVGYIMMGLGLASSYGLIGATVHVFNHALIKATLFLSAGAMIYRTGYRTLHDLRGVGKAMPITTIALSIGAISIVGIPPTAGFLCKWYIALGAFQADQPFFGVALVFGALFIFVYYIRMVNAFYFQPATHPEIAEVSEAPLSMLVPVIILATLCLVMGILGRIPLSFIEPAVTRMLAPLGG